MKQGLILGGRALGSYAAAVLLCPLVLGGIGPEWHWAQIALNVLLLLAMVYVMYVDGGARGERAATLSATLKRMRESGQPIDPALSARRFMRGVALIAYLTAAVPLMLVAAANLIAEPFYPPVITTEPVAPDAPDETMPEAETEPTVINPYNLTARVIFLPALSMYRSFADNPHGLNLMFLAMALLSPLAEPLGYLSGPRWRRKKLEAIKAGKRKKQRNLKVNRPAKPTGPKPLV